MLFRLQGPAMIPMINHEPGLTAVNADILTGNETGFVRCQKQHHIGNIHRISHPSHRLLQGIRSFIDPPGSINPAWRNRIDPHFSRETHSQSMGQGSNSALAAV